MINKRKIINDPVYGFINIPSDLLYDLIEHPYFQRLRRIKQLGLTHLVYPGALHTRFQHSLGAMHLMQDALQVLRNQGQHISREDAEGAMIAILLHDIGHGPFSHALENSIVRGINHEGISAIFMKKMNEAFRGELTRGLEIFRHEHPRKYLSELVSSQIDMDRLDYLTRDSFFTGVSEGVIGTQRIIKMLKVGNGSLVIDVKGIHSIEKFIIARRIMYWQVYLHKTVLAAENMLIKILERAKYLVTAGTELFATPALSFFLRRNINLAEPGEIDDMIIHFALLDDFDIFTAVKVWTGHEDPILSMLCRSLANRKLFKCEIQTDPFDYFYIERLRENIQRMYRLSDSEVQYFLISDTTSNYAYNPGSDKIRIMLKNGRILDMFEASAELNVSVLSKLVTKHFICYPKDVEN